MKRGLICVLMLGLLGSFGLATLAQSAEPIRPGRSVKPGYSCTFSGRPAFDAEWTEDVYEYEGLVVNADGEGKLGPGIRDTEPNDMTGYVMYRVEAAAGRTFALLELTFRGRVFHFGHTAGDDCHLEVQAGTDPESLSSVRQIQAGEDGSSQNYTVPLEGARDQSVFYVKLILRGSSWSWVGLESLGFSGEENLGDEVGLVFEREPEIPEIAEVGQPWQLIGCSAVNTEESVIVSVTDPEGGVVPAEGDQVTFLQLGVHTVSYSVADGDGKVTKGYEVAVCPAPEGEWYEEDLLNEDQYYLTSGSGLTGEEGLCLTGTALYLRRLTFDSALANRVKIRFDILGTSEGDRFGLALTAASGVADLAGFTGAGLYFICENKGGNTSLTGYFSDGQRNTLLGILQLDRPANGPHAIEVRRYNGDPTYADGCEMYVDGQRFSDWLGYSAVFLSKIAPENSLSLTLFSEGTLDLIAACNVDTYTPVLNMETEPSDTAFVGDEITLPQISAVDGVDGEVPYTVTVRDPYGNEEVLEGDSFVPLYANSYAITFSASDYSGNERSRTVRIIVYLKEGAPVFQFPAFPAENGRLGVSYQIPIPEILNLGEGTFGFEVSDPDGQRVQLDMSGRFEPEKLGRYILTYTAENEIGVNREAYFIYVKNNVDEAESYEKVTELSEWTGSGIEQSQDGLLFYGDAYYTRQIAMENGVELTVRLETLADKNQTDCWLSVGFQQNPGYGSFAYQNETGLYFMLFRQGNTYYYNVLTFNSYGRVETIVANCAIGTDLSEIVIRVEKLTGDPSRENHVVIYVNDQKNENFSVNQVQYSDLVDNENFTYLSVGGYGGPGGEESRSIRSGVITRLFFADHTAPEISLDGMLPEKADLGSLFRMPGITIADNVDETFYADIKFYDPSGNILPVPEEGVVLAESGRYALVIKAQDSSGNKTIWIRQIEVSGEEGGTLPVWPFAAGGAVLAVALIGGAVWIFLKKRAKNK